MIVRRQAKDTLTAVELDPEETLAFTLLDGTVREITLEDTAARLMDTTLKRLGTEEHGARTDYRFSARIRVDGEVHELEREVSTPQSFYEPWEIAGLRIWLDAVDAIFALIKETHGSCRPSKHARFGIQDARARICPDALHPWCPLPRGGLRIQDCYRGEDCWLGAYNGASAHGGLDINHPAGTPLWVPLDVDDQFYFNSLDMGHNNNRWRAVRHWDNGAVWILQAHHMTRLLVSEHEPLARGTHFADGAGVLSGSAEHSHFVFKVFDHGLTLMLDPWILFWQMYRDLERLDDPEPFLFDPGARG